MASLTGTKIKDTYDALLKVSDNGALDGTLQTITDGLGNNSSLSLSTAGASVTGTLAVSGTVSTGVLTSSSSSGDTSAIFSNLGAQNSNGIELRGGTTGGTVNWKIEKDNTTSNALQITPSTTNGGTTYTTPLVSVLSSGNVGIGTGTPTSFSGYVTVTTDASSGGIFDIKVNGTRTANFQASATEAMIDVKTAIPLIFNTSGSERMRIDSSGNVVIGHSTSYGGKLTISPSTDPTTPTDSLNQISIGEASKNSAYSLKIGYISDSGYKGNIQAIAGGVGTSLLLNAAGGNVGIGGVPSVPLHLFSNGGNLARFTNNNSTPATTYITVVNANNTSNGTVIAHIDDGTSYIGNQQNAALRFVTNDTERMRIDSSGNVGIGESNPASKLSIGGVQGSTLGSNVALLVGNTGANGTVGDLFQIGLHYNPAGSIASSVIGSVITNGGGYTKSDIFFATRDVTTDTAPIERMRITSGGYLKASNSGSYLNAAGTYHELNSSNSGDTLVIRNTNASGGGIFGVVESNNTSETFFVGFGAASNRIIIYSNGNVVNTNNSYGAISDAKLKENVTDASPKLEDLMQVKVRNFNYIGDDKKQLGVVAQELEEVFPSMIDESPDTEERQVEVRDEEGNIVYKTEQVEVTPAELDEEGNIISEAVYETIVTDEPEMTTEKIDLGTVTKSVKYSVFVPMLIKAIQELNAKVESLESQLNAQ